MDRSRIVTFAVVAFIGGSAACHAGPCTTQIEQVEQAIRQARASAPAGGGPGDASAPQSVGAQLHHQPTPSSVAQAERVANADGDAALARARKADQEGNAAACAKALTETRDLYGLQ
jgi:acyl CoA:acetate/3-ketoacid CoA transferase alpha subunit